MKRIIKALRIIGETMACLAVVSFMMALNWAFWIDGDMGPSREFDIICFVAAMLAVLSFVADYIRARLVRKARRRAEMRRRRRQQAAWRQAS